MNKFLASAIIATACLSALPAAATTWTSAQTGAAFAQSVTFNGIVDGNVQTGLTAKIDYTLNSVVGNVWTFGYKVSNTSSAPITASRISIFGFDVTPDALSSAALSGIFDVVGSGQVPQPNLTPDGALEFCFKASGSSNNCTGGGGDGVLIGANALGTFSLSFSGAPNNLPASVSFVNNLVRYQSISGSKFGDSAIGLPTTPSTPPTGVPEPATWAMMIGGFGLAGVMIRRSRRPLLAA